SRAGFRGTAGRAPRRGAGASGAYPVRRQDGPPNGAAAGRLRRSAQRGDLQPASTGRPAATAAGAGSSPAAGGRPPPGGGPAAFLVLAAGRAVAPAPVGITLSDGVPSRVRRQWLSFRQAEFALPSPHRETACGAKPLRLWMLSSLAPVAIHSRAAASSASR